jgi:hypothetical protein
VPYGQQGYGTRTSNALINTTINKNNKDIFHDLKFCYLNVCGLKSRLLCPDFINIIQQHNICVLTETKLTENI